jgi:group I intron endonuclease
MTDNETASGIYRVDFPCGCLYIGSALSLVKRRNNHISDLRNFKHTNRIMQRHFDKYGESNFRFTVIEKVHPEQLIIREQYYIDTLVPNINVLGVAHSSLGYKHSLETIEKMSRLAKERVSDSVWLDKVSRSWFRKGRKLSAREREVLKSRMSFNNPFLGKRHTSATKGLMSKKAKERDKNVMNLEGLKLGAAASSRRVVLIKNGEKTVYPSIAKLEKFLGFNGSNGSLRRRLASSEGRTVFHNGYEVMYG